MALGKQNSNLAPEKTYAPDRFFVKWVGVFFSLIFFAFDLTRF